MVQSGRRSPSDVARPNRHLVAEIQIVRNFTTMATDTIYVKSVQTVQIDPQKMSKRLGVGSTERSKLEKANFV